MSLTFDEIDALPVGSVIKEELVDAGENDGWSTYQKQEDGLWLLVGTDPEGEADFHLLQALGVVEPVDLDAFRDQWPAGATFRYELQSNEGEVAA